MYTWGYLKDAILAKLDLEEDEAKTMDYLKRFTYYANEAMTQICSTVKPKRTFCNFLIKEDGINHPMEMPEDFVSFGDDVNTVTTIDDYGDEHTYELHDDDFRYYGYNKIQFYRTGTYTISYNARWLIFANRNYDYDYDGRPDEDYGTGQDNKTVLNAPMDVLDCIPSYVASQCLKVDDDVKASVLRNEFEVLLARIDDTNYKTNKTFVIGGDW